LDKLIPYLIKMRRIFGVEYFMIWK